MTGIEREIAEWHRASWPTWWRGGVLDPVSMTAKLAEEAGEVCGAVIKMHDGTGRKGPDDLAGELGDLLLCCAVLADHYGLTLDGVLLAKVNQHVRRADA